MISNGILGTFQLVSPPLTGFQAVQVSFKSLKHFSSGHVEFLATSQLVRLVVKALRFLLFGVVGFSFGAVGRPAQISKDLQTFLGWFKMLFFFFF